MRMNPAKRGCVHHPARSATGRLLRYNPGGSLHTRITNRRGHLQQPFRLRRASAYVHCSSAGNVRVVPTRSAIWHRTVGGLLDWMSASVHALPLTNPWMRPHHSDKFCPRITLLSVPPSKVMLRLILPLSDATA